MGLIIFYEGNGGSQDLVDTRTDAAGQNFRPKVNDEARSCVLLDVRQGCRIRVFDDSLLTGDLTDDFCFIEVKKRTLEYTIYSFERTYEDEFVRVIYGRDDGLDGKVSRVHIL